MDDGRYNRFILSRPPETTWQRLHHTMGPHIIRTDRLTIGKDQAYWVLTDQAGCILKPWEAMEVIQAVTPFYESFSEDQIELINQRIEELGPQVRTIPHADAPREKRSYPGYVYLMQSGPHYKIGASVDPDKRRDYLGTKPPFEIEIVCTIETDDMYGLEAELHERFADKRKNGEWFELEKEDVEYIKGLAI